MRKRPPLLDTPLRISAPYNHDPDYVAQVLDPWKACIGEVYLPVHEVFCHTGRPWTGPHDPDAYDEQVAKLARACRRLRIPLNFVANQVGSPHRTTLLGREILRLHRAHPGSRFTLSDFELAVGLHRREPKLELQPSTVAHVGDPVTAWYWKSEVGSRGITLHRAANKRLDAIRAIRKLGLTVRVVVNDKCLPDCPTERNHGTQIRLYDEVRHAWPEPGAFSGYVGCRRCSLALKHRQFWLVAIKDILPGHLRHLVGLVDLIKLSGRGTPTPSIVASIERYAAMKDLTNDGPFYREPPEAWKRITTCDRACAACGWCEANLVRLPTPKSFGRDGRG
jgi:collagenase-like PrtC family protease